MFKHREFSHFKKKSTILPSLRKPEALTILYPPCPALAGGWGGLVWRRAEPQGCGSAGARVVLRLPCCLATARAAGTLPSLAAALALYLPAQVGL